MIGIMYLLKIYLFHAKIVIRLNFKYQAWLDIFLTE